MKKYKRNKGENCINEGCPHTARIKGRCVYHYNIWRIYERMEVMNE